MYSTQSLEWQVIGEPNVQSNGEWFVDSARGQLSYMAPLCSENISAPYFKQCFFRGGGGYYPSDWAKHHASQSKDRNNKYFILYIEFVAIVRACEDATRVKRRLLFDRVGVFMADIIFTLLSLLLYL